MHSSNVLKKFMRPRAEPYRFEKAEELPDTLPPQEPETEPEPEEEEKECSQNPAYESVFDYASVQTEAILADARKQAARIKADVFAEAQQELDQIRRGARQEGYRDGYAQGLADAVNQGAGQREKEAARMEEELRTFLEKASRAQDDLIDRTTDDLRDLAITVAEKVIRVSLKSSSSVIARMIQGATEKLKRKEWVHIYIAGCDARGIAQVTPGLTASLGALSDHIRIVPMPEEESGTCIIEMPDTIIDASATTQIANIRSMATEISPDDSQTRPNFHRRISDV